MMFMNEWEIDEACTRYVEHPVLGPATTTLRNLMQVVNGNSDGWAYWKAPVRAAAPLMTLIDPPGMGFRQLHGPREDATTEALAKAYSPVRRFRTTSGLDFGIVEPERPIRPPSPRPRTALVQVGGQLDLFGLPTIPTVPGTGQGLTR
jgi:hypothetical protein